MMSIFIITFKNKCTQNADGFVATSLSGSLRGFWILKLDGRGHAHKGVKNANHGAAHEEAAFPKATCN